MKKFFATVISALLLNACAVPITKGDLSAANYGARPNDAKGAAAAYFRKVLIDPDSMKLACSEPYKGWVRQMDSNPPTYGYVMYCEVNAKNKFGGYTGAKPQALLFQNGRIVVVFDETNTVGFEQDRTYGFAE